MESFSKVESRRVEKTKKKKKNKKLLGSGSAKMKADIRKKRANRHKGK